MRAEAAQSGARQALDVARQPLAEAERSAHRLDTEAKTLAELLHVENKKLWPPVIDLLTVEKGFETALGAALGDDLDAPVEPTRADALGRRRRMTRRSGAAGRRRAARRPFISAPPEAGAAAGADRRRRHAADGARLAARSQARPAAGVAGRRSVALGRLRGRRPRADRRGAAPRRAQPSRRHRGGAAIARADADASARHVAAAEAEVAAAADAENAARNSWRARQREADAARDRHAAAERELNRIAAPPLGPRRGADAASPPTSPRPAAA